MSLDKITVDLEFGYTDGQGINHKRVVFRRRTMADDVEIKADATIQELAKSPASLRSPNQTVQFQAITEWRQFNVVLAKKLLESFGTLERQAALAEQVFDKIATSDMERIIDALSSPGEPVIPLSFFLKLAEEVGVPEDKIALIEKGVAEALGNLRPTSEPSAT